MDAFGVRQRVRKRIESGVTIGVARRRPTSRCNGPGLALLAPAAERARWAAGGSKVSGNQRHARRRRRMGSISARFAVLAIFIVSVAWAAAAASAETWKP